MKNVLVMMAILSGACGAGGDDGDPMVDGSIPVDANTADGGGRDTGADDPCASSTDCASCTARPTCGFCRDDGRCVDGSSSGPTDGLCATTSWAWLSSECSCTPICSGDRPCGDDGCGGSCGSCGGGFECSGGSCQPEPAQQWEVLLLSATVAEENQSGDAWDSFGGAPDPQVCLTLDGDRSCSPAEGNTFDATWSPAHSFGIATTTALQSGSDYILEDDDPTSGDDEICSGVFAPTANDLEDGTVELGCDFGSFRLRLDAQ